MLKYGNLAWIYVLSELLMSCCSASKVFAGTGLI